MSGAADHRGGEAGTGPRRVVIFSASVGSGHVRAAEALAEACRREHEGAAVEHVDVLEMTSRTFRKFYREAYLDLIDRLPELWGALHDRTNRPRRANAGDRLRLALERLNLRPFVRFLRDVRPDVIAHAHFLPAEIVSQLRRRGRVTAPHAVVVTDYELHSAWISEPVELYCVPREENRVHLSAFGVSPTSVTVTGIPIFPEFGAPVDELQLRAGHGIDEGRRIVLLLSGGAGTGPVRDLVRRLLGTVGDALLVVVCGRNESLRRGLEADAEGANAGGEERLRVLGFTTEMHEWAAIADLAVTKPGGLTSSEALARGLPLVVVNPIPGQERSNASMLYEAGAALSGENPWTVAHRVGALLADEPRRQRMADAARALGRPDSARAVAAALGRLAHEASA